MKFHQVVLLIVLAAVAGCGTSRNAAQKSANPKSLEQNKAAVVGFYTTAFNEKHPEEAVARYVGATYTQHNPGAADGKEAFIQFVKRFAATNPQAGIDIKRVVAEGNLVVTHGRFRVNEQDRGMAVMDIFRLQDGKIVEHWDVGQRVPEKSANTNTMF